MKIKLLGPTSLLSVLALFAAAPSGHAGIVIGNLPVTPLFDFDMDMAKTQAIAVGFTMTEDAGFTDVIVPLQFSTHIGTFELDLYGNSGSNTPGTLIETLTAPALSPNIVTEYTFTPSAPLTLSNGSTYWLVLQDNDYYVLGWGSQSANSLGGYVPTGPAATYDTTNWANPYPNWVTFSLAGTLLHPSFQIDGTFAESPAPSPTPEPASSILMLTAGAGLLISREVRRRRDA